jgi:hypothetical protein
MVGIERRLNTLSWYRSVSESDDGVGVFGRVELADPDVTFNEMDLESRLTDS